MPASKKKTIETLASVKNVGDHIARQAYEELGVRTISDLADAARDGRLKELDGIGAKKEKAILDSAQASQKPNGADVTGGRVTLDHELGQRLREELGEERIVQMYRDMLHIRRFEEQAGRAYQMGKIKGFCHLYIGQESVAVGAMAAIGPQDYVVAAYREHGHALARGLDPNTVMAELFGKADGVSGGKGGSMHLFDVDKNFYGGWGIVAGHIPTATGVAFASKYREENAVVLNFFGEGSIHQGVFHEAFNMASKWDLPVVFITENNKYAMGTAIERISAVTDIQQKAISYAMDHERVDGKDVFRVYDALDRAVKRAREESRPTFLDIVTYRYRGHSMSDPATYRTREEVEEAQEQGPLVRMRDWLLDESICDKEQLESFDADAKQAAKDAVAFADDAEQPDLSTLTENVYVDWPSDIE